MNEYVWETAEEIDLQVANAWEESESAVESPKNN